MFVGSRASNQKKFNLFSKRIFMSTFNLTMTHKKLKEEKLTMVQKFNLPGTIFAISVHRFP
jgi:hypothetical protein